MKCQICDTDNTKKECLHYNKVMNTTENNKLIAEFMGFKRKGNSHIILLKDGFVPFERNVGHLEFHTSWDWLMPVVQKIDEMGYNVHISRISCKITPILENDNVITSFVCGNVDKKIKLVYDTVVEFTKWYNKEQ
jgi:hypothetical protein